MTRAYYNENDKFAAEWLYNLQSQNLIAPGDIDTRPIQDVRPSDLAGYAQHHFFAGIGIWSAALREAGWPDDRPIWTGSCPCQPFSAAGFAGGFDDERHVWPFWHYLVEQCRPATIVGEQVASPLGLRWYDLVSADLEAAGYACGAVDLCAAGIAVAAGQSEVGRETLEWIRGAVQSCPDPVLAAELRDYAAWFSGSVGIGAAHIRQRLYWVADSQSQHDGRGVGGEGRREVAGRLAEGGQTQGRPAGFVPSGATQFVGNANNARSQGRVVGGDGADQRPVGTTGMACDWIVCTDGKARPTQPGLFPLAHGARSRVGRLRAYGNALHKETAVEFIRAVMDIDPSSSSGKDTGF